ncbi:MAG: type II secretion system protein GspG [Candidatus Aureabacteria bacterium]|nr:type II secretion system protein GspG [Candidatus Auribacterota bacterium]
MKQKKIFEKGFTIVELLAVIAIMLILAGMATVGVTKAQDFSKRRAAQAEIYSFGLALKAYRTDNGDYPLPAAWLADLKNNAKNGPFIEAAVTGQDPWFNNYQYVFPGVNNTDSFDLLSLGKDGAVGGGDDIYNW